MKKTILLFCVAFLFVGCDNLIKKNKVLGDDYELTPEQEQEINLRVKLAEQGYLDMGLPSGTIWKAQIENKPYTYDEAVKQFGDQLPTKEQWEELRLNCALIWIGDSYRLDADNASTLFLPALGYIDCDGIVNDKEGLACFWTSTPDGVGQAYCYSIDIEAGVNSFYRCNKLPVLLVKK